MLYFVYQSNWSEICQYEKKNLLKVTINLLKEELISMGNKNHILLRYATSYEKSEISLVPEGCHYNFEVGAWIVSDTGKLLVDSPGRPKPQTKKHDIETGEDQKGE